MERLALSNAYFHPIGVSIPAASALPRRPVVCSFTLFPMLLPGLTRAASANERIITMSLKRADILDNKLIVRSFYEGGARSEITSFENRLHKDFVLHVPRYLPWGGTFSKAQYIHDVLPQVAAILDFSRLSYESLIAEGDHVVAFINVGVFGTQQTIMISEHWDLVDGQVIELRVAYFEPDVLLEALGRPPLQAVRATELAS